MDYTSGSFSEQDSAARQRCGRWVGVAEAAGRLTIPASQEAQGRTVRDYSRLASTAFSRAHTAVTALVVGAGALGNEVVKNLALLGVTGVWIADRDRIERSNLTRSILYCTNDIEEQIARGAPKAAYAADRSEEHTSELQSLR